MEDLLIGVHPVLASALESEAYDRCHAYGLDETRNRLSSLVTDFSEVNKLLLKHAN